MQNKYLKLCLVTQIGSKSFAEYCQFILTVIQNGVTSIQLREKNLSIAELKSFALATQLLLKPFNIPLIINDHVHLAKEINAEGVHLGQSDLSPLEARKVLGNDKIIGLSIESMQDIKTANQLNCINYIAASAIFPSKTKTDCKTIWRLNGLQQLAQLSIHPIIAIGGINSRNVTKVIKNGAIGIAVVSAIHDDPQPEKITAILINKINNAQRNHYV